MNRRDFLKSAGCACAALALPGPLLQALQAAGPRAGARTLVLVELQGGNDGLNAVVPFSEPRYYALRPSLAVPRESALPLEEGIGLHPALEPLLPAWKEGDLGIVLGLGYPEPNRSHFRSIEIWDTGSDSREYLEEGWVARALAKTPFPEPPSAHGVVLGRGGAGPLSGGGLTTIVMEDPRRFFQEARKMPAPPEPEKDGNPSLRHLLGVQNELKRSAEALQERLKDSPPLKTPFPKGQLGQQLEFSARLIASGASVPVVKAAHRGFDTHSNQKGLHERLLKELGEALAAFRAACLESGTWGEVLVMTYSEFGRRAAENGSAGTDHGTAAPHFLMGGRVSGGLHGKQPSLKEGDLDQGDLVFTTDFRRLYATVSAQWWGLEAERPLPGLVKP